MGNKVILKANFTTLGAMNLTTKFGIDIILNKVNQFKNLKIALACNLASMTSKQEHSRISLLKSGFNITKLFTPEHGFDTQGEDGAFIEHQIDSATQLPLISLYSEKLAPSKKDLEDIDVVFIDLPDIGARFYTYLWTMTYILESCEKYCKKVIILDRPNPLAQPLELAEGPILEESCRSFIGRFGIPVTHQCTFAELAAYFKANYYPKLHLDVIKMENYDRENNSSYIFFPTSPAIQKIDTIYTYAGACLFEGLNINEGRGSDFPFTQFGAPWIDGKLLFNRLQDSQIDTDLDIVEYKPSISLYAGETCYGLRVIPKNSKTFQSFKFFIQVIQMIHELFPDKLKERDYLTNVNPNGAKHLDKLIGIPNSFELLKSGKINTELQRNQWAEKIQPYILY